MAPKHQLPSDICISAALQVETETTELTAADGSNSTVKRFSGIAYTGGEMRPSGFYGERVVIDYEGLQLSDKIPVLREHSSDRIVGHTESHKVVGRNLKVTGVISGVGPDADEVRAMAANEYPWQLSVRTTVDSAEYVESNVKAKVNGTIFTGPGYIVRKSKLLEDSFVALGADSNTNVTIAANRSDNNMTPEEIAAAERARVAAEENRIAQIRRICASANDPMENVETGLSVSGHAIAQGWTVDQTRDRAELIQLRAGRSNTTTVANRNTGLVSSNVIQAAVLQAGRFDEATLLRQFDAPTLQAAHTQFRGRISLNQIFLQCAANNGYNVGIGGMRGQEMQVLKAAFSTADISGILSNIANKYILLGYNGVEQVWSLIAARRNASDFKTMTSYRLVAGARFEKVGPTGELKHGNLGSESYTNKVDTYGRLFQITRQDIINDDLGALTDVPKKLGRGAALELNLVFWTVFLSNASTFWTAGHGNVSTGAGSALGTAGLDAAIKVFMMQTDSDDPDKKIKNPLAIMPKNLLTGPTLMGTALRLNVSSSVNTGGAATDTTVPNSNIYAGRFPPVTSAYLENTNIPGYSTAAWYLLADPNDEPVIEIAFLNGQETPTIEQFEAEPNVLGTVARGYLDFGVAQQSYRGGVRSAGS